MSSNSRMTRSKGPAEELSLPPTRIRKDVSTANEGEKDIQGQVQANVASQQRTVDMQSPFARPGSRAGTCTTPASDGGMLPKASNLFTRPDSCQVPPRRNLHPHSRQYHLRATTSFERTQIRQLVGT